MLAILIADMVGFSELCEQEGGRAGMNAAARFRRYGADLAQAFGGRFVSAWADNFMIAFPDVERAVAAANALVAQIPASVGIGWGDVVEGFGSLWGAEVCRASKRGEDMARAGEVLLTDAARAAVDERQSLD
jgi:class 3 adenylate cyclase